MSRLRMSRRAVMRLVAMLPVLARPAARTTAQAHAARATTASVSPATPATVECRGWIVYASDRACLQARSGAPSGAGVPAGRIQ